MNKIMFLMMFSILLVGTISALEIDNVKDYDIETNTITIKNSFLFIPTSTIATARLDTPQIFKVGAGYGKVAQFTINPYEDYTNIIGEFEFYDLNKDNEKITRQIDIKYLTYEDVQVPATYKEICSVLKNLTEVCSSVPATYKTIQKEVWNDWDKSVYLNKEVVVGLFTDVQVGDRIEWIPTIAGVKVQEWAEWTADLNVGLTDYYTLNSLNGTGTGFYNYITGEDNLRTYNNSLGARIIAGKIGNAINITGTNNGTELTTARNFNGTWTINFWMSPYMDVDTNDAYWQLHTAQGGGSDYFVLNRKTNGTIWIDTPYNELANQSLVNVTWQMITIQSDGTTLYIWKNNSLVWTKTKGTTDWSSLWMAMPRAWSSVTMLGGYDELGIWNRTLTPAEITQLWNSGNGISYAGDLIINNLSPSNNYNTISQTIAFSANVINTTETITISNVSLLINGTINQTNTSGFNGIYNFNANLPYGYWNYTFIAYGNDSIQYNASDGTPNFLISPSIVNSINWNISTSETANESFTINISTNGTSITKGYLWNNGTIYSAAVTNTAGDNYNLTTYFDLPTGYPNQNRTFYFIYTLGGTNYSTTNNTQNVTLTYFTQCNTTYTNDFLNVTFKDEVTNSYTNALIPSATFVYYLGSGLVNKTLTYSNSSNQNYYTFCATPTTSIFNVNPTVQYKQNSTYPQRTWQPTTQSYNSSVFEQVLYLLNSADGLFVTFQLKNLADQVIEGVTSSVNRTSDGVILGAGLTDSAGLITMFLNPDVQHTIYFSKIGYSSYVASIFPTQTSYTITLGGSTSVVSSYARGVTTAISPTKSFLDENTTYNFSYAISSTYYTLDSFTFTLYYGNGTSIGTNTSTANGGVLYLFNVNTTNQSYIIMNYSYVVNGTSANFTRTWVIQSTSGRGYSLWRFFTDLVSYTDSSEGLYGLDDFGRITLSLLAMIVIVGIVSRKYGINNEAAIMSILFGIVFMLDVGLGWIPRIQFGSINASPNFVTFLTFILVVIFILREESR